MPRGKKWEEEEDVCLTLAWVFVSNNPIRGKERKKKDFWGAILEDFKERYVSRNKGKGKESYIKNVVLDRSTQAINSRWMNFISHDCTKFRASYKSIQALNQSGSTEEDKIKWALEVYHRFSYRRIDGCLK